MEVNLQFFFLDNKSSSQKKKKKFFVYIIIILSLLNYNIRYKLCKKKLLYFNLANIIIRRVGARTSYLRSARKNVLSQFGA